MKIEEKKAYKNQKCMECGTVINGNMRVATLSCASKAKGWRLCEKCAPIVKS